MACVLAIRNWTRLKEDAALGIVLSVFFGAGAALLGVAQRMNKGHAAGLESFIYGKTASMLTSDALLMGGAAIVVLVVTGALFKELRMLCFDPAYAQSQGWPVLGLDCVLLGLVAAVTVIGLQAAGLVLIIAMLVIPAAAARFWTERLPVMLIIAGVFGALSGVVGAGASAVYPKLPSGPMIVLVAAALFLGSMFFGTARGVIPRWVVATRFEAKVRRVHLLRALFEGADGERGMEMERLLEMRSWSEGTLRKEVAMARKKGLLRAENGRTERVELTETGWNAAAQVVRQHRLWETYLIEYADIAPSHVDRDADAIEHVLSPELVAELESLLAARPLLESPHQLSHATQNRPPHG
jgi:manganese/zinc/iron transport system permease protein